MKLQELKAFVTRYMATEEVKTAYGKLTLKDTWEAACDRCKEYAAIAVDEAMETAGLLLEHGAIAVQDVIAETVTYDSIVAVTMSATALAQKAMRAVYDAVFFACVFVYQLGEEYGKDYYRARNAAAEIEAEDLAVKPSVTAAEQIKAVVAKQVKHTRKRKAAAV